MQPQRTSGKGIDGDSASNQSMWEFQTQPLGSSFAAGPHRVRYTRTGLRIANP